ncbi:hypothetical protein F8388_025656 [Cannabis sativa]|uniref:Uncharacterized protein n=1 Tax=Cannabis sativa TaxID=3483 RepID=A0A7J6G1C1_CANSA|nr:hypothetical protein F8388_025656 [Cannabis sativa]
MGSERLNGTVKWFNDQKGYGFITPSDGTEDLFVHQSAIRSDGFRSLADGETVEFQIETENNRTKAVDVTGPNEGPVQGTRGGSGGGGGRGGSRGGYGGGGRGGRGGGDGGCFKCGESGHMARDCFQGGSSVKCMVLIQASCGLVFPGQLSQHAMAWTFIEQFGFIL